MVITRLLYYVRYQVFQVRGSIGAQDYKLLSDLIICSTVHSILKPLTLSAFRIQGETIEGMLKAHRKTAGNLAVPCRATEDFL
jgi:Flp pilus assembly protein protease CpaA